MALQAFLRVDAAAAGSVKSHDSAWKTCEGFWRCVCRKSAVRDQRGEVGQLSDTTSAPRAPEERCPASTDSSTRSSHAPRGLQAGKRATTQVLRILRQCSNAVGDKRAGERRARMTEDHALAARTFPATSKRCAREKSLISPSEINTARRATAAAAGFVRSRSSVCKTSARGSQVIQRRKSEPWPEAKVADAERKFGERLSSSTSAPCSINLHWTARAALQATVGWLTTSPAATRRRSMTAAAATPGTSKRDVMSSEGRTRSAVGTLRCL